MNFSSDKYFYRHSCHNAIIEKSGENKMNKSEREDLINEYKILMKYLTVAIECELAFEEKILNKLIEGRLQTIDYLLTKQIDMKKTVEKMVKIVRGRTGASEVYADMLLSMLPNSTHKVNISYWNYKADRDDFRFMQMLMKNSQDDLIFEYDMLLVPYVKELEEFTNSKL